MESDTVHLYNMLVHLTDISQLANTPTLAYMEIQYNFTDHWY